MSLVRHAVVTAPGVVEIRSTPAPVPGPGEVLVRLLMGGVCGSWSTCRRGGARDRLRRAKRSGLSAPSLTR